jgi:hypothetical protein
MEIRQVSLASVMQNSLWDGQVVDGRSCLLFSKPSEASAAVDTRNHEPLMSWRYVVSAYAKIL